jgi:tRNA uridine 5-carbamoylmethylation protein Kti12
MFTPTTDRDVRLSEAELDIIIIALRDEVAKRNRSIKRAIEAREAGRTIKHGMLDEHYRAAENATAAKLKAEVALTQLRRLKTDRVKEKLGI